ncbi:MAG: type I-C CRISPR-associated endonuclease Cas1 [Pirellulaceae bacterium]|nr:type I-C CRISPR-associated endonuclease Cas1 [Pirellulaceae bacterium]
MKKHDNTLYVTTQGAYLAREGNSVLVRVEKQTRLRVPIHNLGGIVCFGNVGCSPFLMGLCGQEGVGISFLTRNGRFLARVLGPQKGNVLLRRAQHRMTADQTAAADFARIIIAAKIANARTVLQRARRDHGDRVASDRIDWAVRRLGNMLAEMERSMPLDEARGKEGEAAKAYFSAFDNLILQRKDAFFFRERTRRPPRDNINALLSFLYSLLINDVAAACQSIGLDPQMGFLHGDRAGRASLALDLVEELRPMVADRLALSLVNRQQVEPKGFTQTETGGVEMDDATRKTLLVAYQKRKDEELMHPFLKEKVTVGLLPHVQARLLARWIRGELDAYPPFFWK